MKHHLWWEWMTLGGELPDMQRHLKSEVSFLHLALKTLMVRLVSRSISALEGKIVPRRAGAEVIGVDGKLMVVAGVALCYKCMSTSGSYTQPNVLKVIIPHPPCILEGYRYLSPGVLFPISHSEYQWPQTDLLTADIPANSQDTCSMPVHLIGPWMFAPCTLFQWTPDHLSW